MSQSLTKGAGPFLFALCFIGSALLLCSAMVRVAAAAEGIRYVASIEGVQDAKLLMEMKDLSDTFVLKDRPPLSENLLRKRAEEDQKVFLQLLKAYGYYRARVEVEFDSASEPLKVTFRVEPGSSYSLKSADLRTAPESREQSFIMPKAEEIGLTLGEPFRTRTLMDAEKKLLRKSRREGFPYSRIADRKVTVDHETESVALILWFDPGPRAQFGPTEVTGLASVDEMVVRRQIPWKEGERFNVDLLEELQKRLLNLGLFSMVRVTASEGMDAEGRLLITIALTERKHRSVSAGVSYYTDEGPGAKFSWEDRNLFHQGERLGATLTFSDYTLSGEGGFLKPYFMREDQSFRVASRLAKETPPAYTSRNFETTGFIDRNLASHVKLSAGLGFRMADVTQFGEPQSYTYFTIPLQLERDTSDDLLDPGQGSRLGLYAIPYLGASTESPDFAKGYLKYSHYLAFSRNPRLILAGRMTLGVSGGANSTEIPADERFYAGGGGSIRGYPYQSVGPSVDGQPTGGGSLFEVSLESRLKITERFGLVAFLDGGNAYTKNVPDFSESLKWGAGAGMLYYTPIGPLRCEIGFPLNKVEGVDSLFQVYLSLGQAF